MLTDNLELCVFCCTSHSHPFFSPYSRDQICVSHINFAPNGGSTSRGQKAKDTLLESERFEEIPEPRNVYSKATLALLEEKGNNEWHTKKYVEKKCSLLKVFR